ncbi:hypothetical protein [Cupriavidus sp. YAF13]|uniref:hypothetical protein n=1 Tax=Cupriavidus sp. YAF13 TaxID=3233075 RepID=UPI003F8E72E5
MWLTTLNTPARPPNSDFLRRHARRLLRQLHAEQAMQALPVIRRIHRAQVRTQVRTESVAELYRLRHTLQLKHCLQLLAAELGYTSWSACKRDIDGRPARVLDRYRLDLGQFGDYQQLWFADRQGAQAWQASNGGYVVAYGEQAAVLLTGNAMPAMRD